MENLQYFIGLLAVLVIGIYLIKKITGCIFRIIIAAVVLGVAHKEFLDLDIENLKKENAVVYDVKGFLKDVDMKL